MFRFSSIIFLALIACHQDIAKPAADTDGASLDETGTPADTGSEDTGVIDTDGTDTETEDTATDTRPLAVLEGSMSTNGIQEGNPGNTFLMGDWTFHLESLDGEAHSTIVTPTAFAFTLDTDGDTRFGLPTDDAAVAGDVLHHCWFLVQDSFNGIAATSSVGGPELNSMSGTDYPAVTVRTGNDMTIGFMCETFDNAPTGVKIAASMNYDVVGTGIYDASTARTDNTGVLPQYYLRID